MFTKNYARLKKIESTENNTARSCVIRRFFYSFFLDDDQNSLKEFKKIHARTHEYMATREHRNTPPIAYHQADEKQQQKSNKRQNKRDRKAFRAT